MKDLLKFSIPGKPQYLQTIKLAIGSAASTVNFSIEAIEDIKIAVAEACRNISCHGSQGYSTDYDIDCQISDDEITITVADKTNQHTLTKNNPQCLDCPREGDLALSVIKTLMDKVEINQESEEYKSIKMVKYNDRPGTVSPVS